jgi:hypothetical protein
VRLNYTLATRWPQALSNTGKQVRRSFMWSSHLKFSKPVSEISDAQYRERKPTNRYECSRFRGNEIILASSEKGQHPFAYEYPESNVRKSLQLCQITWEVLGGADDNKHQNQSSCGEVMSTQMYYTRYNSPLADQKARICTVLFSKKKRVKRFGVNLVRQIGR